MTHTPDSSRALLRLSGSDVLHFLQGLLTQDVNKLAEEKIQFAALLSAQGKILHELFLVAQGEDILIDTHAADKPLLLKRLTMYKLRANVSITDVSDAWGVSYSTAHGMADPRHSELPHRVYATGAGDQNTSLSPEAYQSLRLTLGIPELGADYASDSVVALDAGLDLLHGVSFTKGCYVGQEITARMHYKNIARRGFYILEHDAAPRRLALLKFEEMEAADHRVTLDGIDYHAHLPEWMAPKFAQFLEGKKEGGLQ